MKKIFQTITEKGKGNCTDACIASLLEIPLEDVPHFNGTPDWIKSLMDFLNKHGYILEWSIDNPNYSYLRGFSKIHTPKFDIKNALINESGIDGLFYAGVISPNFYKKDSGEFPQHAVIVDKNGLIVHDPHPKYQDIMANSDYPEKAILGSNGIIDVFLIRKK